MLRSVGVLNIRSGLASFALVLGLALGTAAVRVEAATPAAPPLTVDAVVPNLFYGAIPPNGQHGPVIVFVHGLQGSYQNWIESQNCPTVPPAGPACTGANNTMYDQAYQAGFRTAFMSLSPDNSNNNTSIQTNAAVLQGMFPRILSQYSVTKVYFVCHSKGGLDLEDAIATPQWLGMANMVMTLGTPNQGDALADWIFLPANQALGQTLGLLTPAVQSMEVANVQSLRLQWDPLFQKAGIPFYTLSGNTSNCTHGTGCSTAITGPILTSITTPPGGTAPYNDGLVDHPESLLPTTYAMEIGVIHANHFALLQGSFSFPFVYGHVIALDNSQPGFKQVSNGGFGDEHNTWSWSMAWFNNKLYVGTGREVYCVTSAVAAIQLGLPGLYPPSIGDCTPDYHYLPLQAEIWQYDPSTNIWTKVFESEASLNILDNTGNPVTTGRDIGFRGLQVVTEPGGVTALYAGGVTSGELFECSPPNKTTGCAAPGTWPPPRILRTADGVNWAPVAENGTLTTVGGISSWTPAAGSFLGSLTANGCYGTVNSNCPDTTQYPNYSIRSAAQLNGTLFLQVGDYPGVGRVISAATGVNPKDGDNCGQAVCYQWASPPTTTLPTWILQDFNNFMYAGTGTPPGAPTGTYGVFKTDGVTPPPAGSNWAYNWTSVITNGAYATGLIADYAMSLQVFVDTHNCTGIGCLYVGTDRPNELVRIHPDDTWDLVIGNPRTIPPGQPGAGQLKAPLSGIGQYFDNGFTGHFWRMGVGGQGLYMGTWDWSADNAGQPSFGPLWSQEFGTDIWRTRDGVHWSFVSKVGLGDGNNTGGRSFVSACVTGVTSSCSPYGVFMGTARSIGGTQVFRLDNSNLDFNRDGVIDQKDVSMLTARVGQKAKKNDPMDMNQDGTITRADAQLLQKQCTYPGCTVPAFQPAATSLTPPVLNSAPGALTVGAPVSLSWNAVTGAVDYLVYRITLSGSETTPPPASHASAAAACNGATATQAALCSQLPAAQGAAATNTYFGYPGAPVLMTRVSTPAFSDSLPGSSCGTPPVACALQAIYFVRAEDASGNLSAPSNVVGGPSLAAQ